MLHCIKAIHNSLSPSGTLYAVDFISSSSILFNRWMNFHGVYIRSEIISILQNTLKSGIRNKERLYGFVSVWNNKSD